MNEIGKGGMNEEGSYEWNSLWGKGGELVEKEGQLEVGYEGEGS